MSDDYFISDGVVAIAYVAVRMWLLAAHEARMEGRTIYFINAMDARLAGFRRGSQGSLL